MPAIRQLASFGPGIRDISRGIGQAPSTIRRWVRITGNRAVASAMEEGRPDMSRAMSLARINDPDQVERLIGVAHDMARQRGFVALPIFDELVNGRRNSSGRGKAQTRILQAARRNQTFEQAGKEGRSAPAS